MTDSTIVEALYCSRNLLFDLVEAVERQLLQSITEGTTANQLEVKNPLRPVETVEERNPTQKTRLVRYRVIRL